MEQMWFRLLLVVFLAESWLSLKVAQCENTSQGACGISLCYNKSPGETCFVTFFPYNTRPVHKNFSTASDWCKANVPDSYLIIITGQEYQRTCEGYLKRQKVATVRTGAVKPSESKQPTLPLVNGHPTKLEGATITYITREYVNPDDSADTQCTCISQKCSSIDNIKHIGLCEPGDDTICDCNNISAIVCQTEQSQSFQIKEFSLVVLLFVAIVFIVVVVIVVLRKRKNSARENEESSSMKTKQQSEPASSEHVTMVPHNGPSDGTVPLSNTTYVEVEMTQRPTPSNNAIYASVEPTGGAVDMGKKVVYADLDLPQKVQQKPKIADETAVCLSPIYTTPYEPPISDINTVYAEPFQPEKPHTTTGPVLTKNAVADQENIYSLASQIPLHYPNVVYSECNKPRKSPTLTGKRVQDAGPISLEANQVKHPTAARGAGPLDQSTIYAEPCKMKMSP